MDSQKPWMIMKFGGTSIGLADRMRQVVNIIRKTRETYRPVVVLSAMSSHRKSEGTTSRLMAATEEVLKPHSKRHIHIVEALERDHLAAAESAIDDVKIKETLLSDLRQDFKRLRNFLEAAEIIDEISPRSRDIIIGSGEKLSCRLFTAVLQSHGLNAVFVPMDRCVDIQVDETQLDQRFYDYLRNRSASIVVQAAYSDSGLSDTCTNASEKPGFRIPVVTGFIGPIPGGIIDAIGRGYTDFTAALVASGLKTLHGPDGDHLASVGPMSDLSVGVLRPELQRPQPVAELQIWKEVDGIFTADPRKVSTAQHLESIFPDEAAELTYYGSEVIHPFTMEQVIRTKVPIRIKNTFKPDNSGTTILPEEDYEASTKVVHPQPVTSPQQITATACTLKSDVLVLNVHSNRKSVSHGFLAKIFSALDRYGIVVDLISTSEVHVSMVISLSSLGLDGSDSVSASTLNLLAEDQQSNGFRSGTATPLVSPPAMPPQSNKLDLILRELKSIGSVSMVRNMAILSLVGKRMRNMVGIAGKMFSVLAKEGVNLEMISQGASEINISCVVLESEAVKALQAVHDHCVLGR